MTNADKLNPTSARTAMFRGSIYGALIWSSVASLHQDCLGRDAYIQLVQTHWVDACATVPVAIAMLVIVAAIYCVDAIRSRTP